MMIRRHPSLSLLRLGWSFISALSIRRSIPNTAMLTPSINDLSSCTCAVELRGSSSIWLISLISVAKGFESSCGIALLLMMQGSLIGVSVSSF